MKMTIPKVEFSEVVSYGREVVILDRKMSVVKPKPKKLL